MPRTTPSWPSRTAIDQALHVIDRADQADVDAVIARIADDLAPNT